MLGLIFCTIGILWSVNIGGPEAVLHQPQPMASDIQLLPVQSTPIWYSPMIPESAVQTSNPVQSRSPWFELYMIQGAMLLGVFVIVLSMLLVGRRQVPEERAAEVHASNPDIVAARILEMDHERARLAIAELRGAHRLEVLQSIVVLGDTPEDIRVVQVPAQEQLELTRCG